MIVSRAISLQVFFKGGPYGENPLKEMMTKEKQKKIWDGIATNLNTAARLLENQQQFVLQKDAVTE